MTTPFRDELGTALARVDVLERENRELRVALARAELKTVARRPSVYVRAVGIVLTVFAVGVLTGFGSLSDEGDFTATVPLD
jgi:hypothetical protein